MEDDLGHNLNILKLIPWIGRLDAIFKTKSTIKQNFKTDLRTTEITYAEK